MKCLACGAVWFYRIFRLEDPQSGEAPIEVKDAFVFKCANCGGVFDPAGVFPGPRK